MAARSNPRPEAAVVGEIQREKGSISALTGSSTCTKADKVMSDSQHSLVPSARIGDLLWCREMKHTPIWWPAMVTYHPQAGTYFRSSGKSRLQYHVQYFGISPVRGWVFAPACEELKDAKEKVLPEKGVSKKMRREHVVAIQEVSEALQLDHKQRKLKFIFSYGPPPRLKQPKEQPKEPKPTPKPITQVVRVPLKVLRAAKPEKLVPNRTTTQESGITIKTEQNGTPPKTDYPAFDYLGKPIRKAKARHSFIPLESPTRSPPKSRITPPTDSTAIQPKPHQNNVRYSLPLGAKRSLDIQSCSSDSEGIPLPKRPLLDMGGGANDCSSDISAPSITSAILTPPSSCADETPSTTFDVEQSERQVELIDTLSEGERKPKRKHRRREVKEEEEEPGLRAGVCSICDGEDDSLLHCEGMCYQGFHLDCLGLMRLPSFKFVCDECLTIPNQCFVCKKAGGQILKCNKPQCTKKYHMACIENNKLFSFDERKQHSFTCPLHTCARCKSTRNEKTNHSDLVQCTKCPFALHKQDCLIAGCEILDSNRMICYQHLLIERKISLYSPLNFNTCLECGGLGSLLCCDFCAAAYHLKCMEEEFHPRLGGESESWRCPSCVVYDLPTYGSMVICKFGKWRWWPCEVVPASAIPDNIEAMKPGQCMFVVKFCGSHDYGWTYHGRALPYAVEEERAGGIGKKSPIRGYNRHEAKDMSKIFKKAHMEAEQLYRSKEVAREARESKQKRPESRAYTRIRSNKYLIPRPIPDEDWHSLPCQCTPANPCKDDSTCVNRAIHVECDPKSCPVGPLCQNQKMQKCQYADTTPFYTGGRGWGLKANQDISASDFVIEYVGEVLDTAMCKERLKRAHETNLDNFYMLTLDSRNGLVIDAGQKSNHARFINHSCEPNCETQKWTVRGTPRIGIFARDDIAAGTELTFDYQLDSLGNDKKRCLCGSKKCSGFLGLKLKSESHKAKTNGEKQKQRKTSKGKKKCRQSDKQLKENSRSEQVDTHEDDCFLCGDGGELLLCDHKRCVKVYHLHCLGRKMVPSRNDKWECPRHFCQVCQKKATAFCTSCPVSYCDRHKVDRFSEFSGEPQCLEYCSRMDTTTLETATQNSAPPDQPNQN